MTQALYAHMNNKRKMKKKFCGKFLEILTEISFIQLCSGGRDDCYLDG
jgi:hypothetical protein